MADFSVRAYLPEDPKVNLAAKIPSSGFTADAKAPIPPETERDVFIRDMKAYFVTSDLVPKERIEDVVFDFGPDQ